MPDFTEDLADEITSELDPGRSRRDLRWPRHRLACVPALTSLPRRTAQPRPRGILLRDRYLLETQIGNGGTATVYRAVDLRRDTGTTDDGRRVAIKLLRPELRERPQSVARLQREFRQTQAVAHPNVVRFLDLDCDGDAWFIVMELLSGETLGPLLRRPAHAGLPVAEALRIALCRRRRACTCARARRDARRRQAGQHLPDGRRRRAAVRLRRRAGIGCAHAG